MIVRGLEASLTVRGMLAIFTGVVLHELGHILFGRLVRIPITGVVIGEGRRLCGWRMGAITFTIHAIPTSGYVEHAEYHATPLRSAVVAAGGIVVNVAVGIACLAFCLAAEPVGWVGKMLWAIALTHLALAAMSLAPRQYKDGNKSDGLLLLEAWRGFERGNGSTR
ncbi:MAG: site-2 protease family protein [Bradyrhizobium sp.]|uniref:site-2 protease family protein n=1 Tax=Bradyrhizobium sp. TaxID=376 RepID=UPI0025B8445C|nr:site-2 protease family protein [Bradyrhizobium sp.]MBI5263636.1 site-2 protease family protein [Bradyrhizobium sp.]